MRVLRSQLTVEQRIFWRNRSGVFFTFVFPLILLGFMSIFQDRVRLVPGIAALAIVSTSFQGLTISLAMHREQGVLKRLMATPLPPATLVLAKILSASIVAVISVAAIAAVGVATMDVPLPREWGLLLVAAVAGVAAATALGFALTSAIRSGESAPAVTNAIYLPTMFISGIFYPVSQMPHVLQVAARVLPLWHLVAPLRGAWLGTMGVGAALWHVAVLLAWAALGTIIAVRRFHFSPSTER